MKKDFPRKKIRKGKENASLALNVTKAFKVFRVKNSSTKRFNFISKIISN